MGFNSAFKWLNTCSSVDRDKLPRNYEISTMWETKPKTTPQKISRLLVGPEQVTRPKNLQAIWWWWLWRWCD